MVPHLDHTDIFLQPEEDPDDICIDTTDTVMLRTFDQSQRRLTLWTYNDNSVHRACAYLSTMQKHWDICPSATHDGFHRRNDTE